MVEFSNGRVAVFWGAEDSVDIYRDLWQLRRSFDDAIELEEHEEPPRLFQVDRDHDVVGVSGTGLVAEGAVSHDGRVALTWLGEYQSVAVYDSIKVVEAVHCSGGNSRISFQSP